MRIYLKLTRNTELIPYNYQSFLTGALHKWMGENNVEHGQVSLYSFSWLQNMDAVENGLNTKFNSSFFISAHNDFTIKSILSGIREDPAVCFGIRVSDVIIQETPLFNSPQRFELASPVFIRRFIEEKDYHITYDDERSAGYLTETMKKKLLIAGLPDSGVRIRFEETYASPKTKVIKYKDIGNKVNICPVVVEGTPEQLSFVWNVGVGNCTGIGFGALK